MENVQIALLGLGTVGTGVYKVLKAQKEEISHKVGTEIQLKKILVRNTKKAAEKLDGSFCPYHRMEEYSGGSRDFCCCGGHGRH